MAALIGVSLKPKDGGSDYICTVPLDLLSEDGVPPAEGDEVDYSVTGTIQSVSGTSADVKIDSVNGQPVSEEAGEGAGDTETGPGEGAAATPPAPGSSASMRPGLAAAAKKGGLGMF